MQVPKSFFTRTCNLIMKRIVALTIGFLLFGMLSLTSQAQDLVVQTTITNGIERKHEALLIRALGKIKDNHITAALSDLEYLVKINPKFRLAQLMYADLLLSRGRPITDFGNLPYAPYEDIVALREEAQARWQHHHAPKVADKIPSEFVQLDEKQKYAIIVDLSAPRLYVYENRNGIPKLLADFYVTIGKNGLGKFEEGDQRTPVGVYFVSGFIEPEKLPDLYGDGAFPINYPNAWDRRNGHTGFGIWLHGTPSYTYSRPPRDSNGCIIVSNQDLMTIASYIKIGRTPVILAGTIDWIKPEQWLKQQAKYKDFIEQWRQDWESLDTDLYLSHYSKEYSGLGKDYGSWVNYKHRVNLSKKFINVGLSQTSIFLYPDNANIMVVTFEQDYKSDTFKRRYRKRQYWRMEKDGKWRIFYEGSVS